MVLGPGGKCLVDALAGATALLHSVVVAEQREQLKSWTVLAGHSLAFPFFAGTFIVRSGLLTSVHRFASDPARGLFILLLLGLAIGLPLHYLPGVAHSWLPVLIFRRLAAKGALDPPIFYWFPPVLIVLVGAFYPLALEWFPERASP